MCYYKILLYETNRFISEQFIYGWNFRFKNDTASSMNQKKNTHTYIYTTNLVSVS